MSHRIFFWSTCCSVIKVGASMVHVYSSAMNSYAPVALVLRCGLKFNSDSLRQGLNAWQKVSVLWSPCTPLYDDHHAEGVTVIFRKDKDKSLIEWDPINERHIRARLNSSFCKLTVI